jgi:hypothetical protein
MENGQKLEAIYTPKDVAKLLKFDESTIRRMFIDEPGVFVFGREQRRDGKRDYVSLRIPESVVRRVLDQRAR